MSLAKIFGNPGGREDEAPTTEDAIQKLTETEELLKKQIDIEEKKVKQYLAIARQNGLENKRVALGALVRKRIHEKQTAQLQRTLSTIECQRKELENASTNTEVLMTMSYAAKALKAANQLLDVDDVHDMMDDIQEQTELADEIAEAISNEFGHGFDEDDLLAELKDLVNGPSTGSPPSASVTKSAVSTKIEPDHDNDMSELAAWAN